MPPDQHGRNFSAGTGFPRDLPRSEWALPDFVVVRPRDLTDWAGNGVSRGRGSDFDNPDPAGWPVACAGTPAPVTVRHSDWGQPIGTRLTITPCHRNRRAPPPASASPDHPHENHVKRSDLRL
jgi:hypothetical protein